MQLPRVCAPKSVKTEVIRPFEGQEAKMKALQQHLHVVEENFHALCMSDDPKERAKVSPIIAQTGLLAKMANIKQLPLPYNPQTMPYTADQMAKNDVFQLKNLTEVDQQILVLTY